jgi:metacaspase-1
MGGMGAPPMGGMMPGMGGPPPMGMGGMPGMGMGMPGGFGGMPPGAPVPLTGKKKALLVGINYLGAPRGQLKGCINDVKNVQKFLVQRFGFSTQNMIVLTDDARDPRKMPTRANVLAAIDWLVVGAAAGDSLFFQFSGHGSQVPDTNGDEDDGLDEVIICHGMRRQDYIIDDELHARMCMRLPLGCRLTAIMDACHSGSGLDLPYEIFAPSASANFQKKAQSKLEKKRMKKLKKQQKKQKKQKKMGGAAAAGNLPGTTHAHVIGFSGCKDDQTSADASIGGQSSGAMTYAFLKTLTENPNQTYTQLLASMHRILHAPPRRFTQEPQLSLGRPFPVNSTRFEL